MAIDNKTHWEHPRMLLNWNQKLSPITANHIHGNSVGTQGVSLYSGEESSIVLHARLKNLRS
jgi:hypothetical protein